MVRRLGNAEEHPLESSQKLDDELYGRAENGSHAVCTLGIEVAVDGSHRSEIGECLGFLLGIACAFLLTAVETITNRLQTHDIRERKLHAALVERRAQKFMIAVGQRPTIRSRIAAKSEPSREYTLSLGRGCQ